MFKKILLIGLFGLLAITQVSWGMDCPRIYYSNAHKRSTQPTQELKQGDKVGKKTTAAEILDVTKAMAAICGGEYAKVYGASYGLIFAHEFGHWSLNKLLLKNKGFIWIPPMQFLPLRGMHYHISLSEVVKHFINNPQHIFKAKDAFNAFKKYYWKKNLNDKMYQRVHLAAQLAAGPLFGCLASCLLLKGNTFYNEYEKNKNLESALCQTQKQSLFNSNQNFFIQLLAALHIHGNLIQNLYPWGNKPNFDGDRIFDALKIANTRPLLRKAIGMSLGTLTACALGKAIFDAWKDKF